MNELLNIITTTLSAWSKDLFDNVLNQNKTLFCFDALGKYLEVDGLGKNDNMLMPMRRRGAIVFLKGGKDIEEDVSLSETPNSGTVDYNEDLATDEAQVFQMAKFPWKTVYANAVYFRLQEKVNQDSGKTQKHKLVDSLVKNAESTLLNRLGENMFNDPTVNPKGFHGIQYLISDDGTSGGALPVGGISTATYPNWANQFENLAANYTPDQLRQAMSKLYYKLRFGADLIITTPDLYMAYESSLVANVRFQSLKQLQDAWFSYLVFHNAAIIYDDNCPANRMYFLSFKAIALNILGDDLVTIPSEPEHPAGTQKYIWPCIVDGNFSVRSRRDLGVLVVAAA